MPHRCANGKERRVPLAADRSAALAMLNELVRKAEREAAGLADPFEAHRKRSLVDHLAEYKKHLESKGTTKDHVQTTHQRALAIVDPDQSTPSMTYRPAAYSTSWPPCGRKGLASPAATTINA